MVDTLLLAVAASAVVVVCFIVLALLCLPLRRRRNIEVPPIIVHQEWRELSRQYDRSREMQRIAKELDEEYSTDDIIPATPAEISGPQDNSIEDVYAKVLPRSLRLQLQASGQLISRQYYSSSSITLEGPSLPKRQYYWDGHRPRGFGTTSTSNSVLPQAEDEFEKLRREALQSRKQQQARGRNEDNDDIFATIAISGVGETSTPSRSPQLTSSTNTIGPDTPESLRRHKPQLQQVQQLQQQQPPQPSPLGKSMIGSLISPIVEPIDISDENQSMCDEGDEYMDDDDFHSEFHALTSPSPSSSFTTTTTNPKFTSLLPSVPEHNKLNTHKQRPSRASLSGFYNNLEATESLDDFEFVSPRSFVRERASINDNTSRTTVTEWTQMNRTSNYDNNKNSNNSSRSDGDNNIIINDESMKEQSESFTLPIVPPTLNARNKRESEPDLTSSKSQSKIGLFGILKETRNLLEMHAQSPNVHSMDDTRLWTLVNGKTTNDIDETPISVSSLQQSKIGRSLTASHSPPSSPNILRSKSTGTHVQQLVKHSDSPPPQTTRHPIRSSSSIYAALAQEREAILRQASSHLSFVGRSGPVFSSIMDPQRAHPFSPTNAESDEKFSSLSVLTPIHGMPKSNISLV